MKSSSLITKNLLSGVIFFGIGLIFLWGGLNYRFGTSRQMGPGYFPIVLSCILMALGVLVAFIGFTSRDDDVEPLSLKGILFVLGSILVFAFLIRPAGMPIAIFALSFLGSMASSQFRLVPSVLLSAGLAVFCLVVFNWMLGMPFPVWGYWFK